MFACQGIELGNTIHDICHRFTKLRAEFFQSVIGIFNDIV